MSKILLDAKAKEEERTLMGKVFEPAHLFHLLPYLVPQKLLPLLPPPYHCPEHLEDIAPNVIEAHQLAVSLS